MITSLVCASGVAAQDKTILILGDSLSSAYGISKDAGWVTLLQKKLQQQKRPWNIVNASVSGDTTRTGLNRLQPALKQHKPAIVIVELGGNDGLRGFSFNEIEQSLAKIIRMSREHGARVLLVGVRLPPNYGPYYNQQFAALYQRLSKQYNIPLVPQLLANVAEHRELMQQDGMHPVASAQPRVMHNVYKILEPLLN